MIFDIFFVTIVADEDSVVVFESLSRMGTTFVRSLGDINWLALSLMTAFNWSSWQVRRLAFDINPSDFVLITNKDLIFVEFKLLAVVRNASAFRSRGRCLANMDSTLDEYPSDVEGLSIDLTTNDSISGDVLSIDKDPGSWSTRAIFMIIIGPALAFGDPVAQRP